MNPKPLFEGSYCCGTEQ